MVKDCLFHYKDLDDEEKQSAKAGSVIVKNISGRLTNKMILQRFVKLSYKNQHACHKREKGHT